MSPQLDSLKPLRLTFPCLVWFIGCLAVFLANLPSVAIAADLENALQTCVETVTRSRTPNADDQPFTLAEICPALHSSLKSSIPEDFFEPPLGQEVTLSQIQDVVAFFEASHQPLDQRFQFDYVGLQDLLSQTLIEEPHPSPSLWELFLQWLREQLQGHEAEDFPWLIEFFEWMEQFQWLTNWVIYGTAGFIVFAAILIVGYEIRHSPANWFLKKSGSPSSFQDLSNQTPASSLTWEDVLALSPNHQPAAILRWVIASFIRKKQLPHNESLTNKEFIGYLRSLAHPQTEQFGELVTITEGVVYGSQPLNETQREKLIQTADCLRS